MPFTVTLLGTSVAYNPKNDEINVYARGETLSIISSLIADTSPSNYTLLNEDGVHRLNKAATVIDGPGVLGIEVGDRITKAVIAILEAMQRGETQINILGFSRGAVEAILVAHELERIVQLVKNSVANKTAMSEEQLANSVCASTKASMITNKTRLYELVTALNPDQFSKLSLAVFNLDPVPGEEIVSNNYIRGDGWYDSRFFTIPEIVSEYTQFAKQNELSYGFAALIPTPVSEKTKYNLDSLPGHHGTASGNLNDQNGKSNTTVGSKTDTRHVQDLVLLKMLQFLKERGVQVDLSLNTNLHPEIKALVEKFLASDTNLNDEFINLYNFMIENEEAYKYFDKTCYTYTKVYSDLQRRLHPRKNTASYKASSLAEALPTSNSRHFINTEHARLYIQNEIGNLFEKPFPELFMDAINFVIKSEEKRIQSELNDSFIVSDAKKIANEPSIAELIQEAVCTIVNQWSHNFLNDSTKHPGESELLFKVLDCMLRELKQLKNKELAGSVYHKLKAELANTLTTKFSRLIDEAKVLRESYIPAELNQVELQNSPKHTFIEECIECFNSLQKFKTNLSAFEVCELDLDIKMNQTNLELQQKGLLFSLVQYIAVNQLDVDDLKQLIPEILLEKITPLVNKMAVKKHTALHQKELAGFKSQAENTQSALEQKVNGFKNDISMLQQQIIIEQNRIQELDVQDSSKTKAMSYLEEQVKELQHRIQELDAQDSSKTKAMSYLEEQVKELQHRIQELDVQDSSKTKAMGHLEEQVNELQHRIRELNVQDRSKTKAMSHLEEQVNELQHRIRELDVQDSSKTKAMSYLNDQVKELQLRIQELNVQDSSKTKAMGYLNDQVKELQHRIRELDVQDSSKTEAMSSLEKQIKELQNRIQELVALVGSKSQTINDLQQQLIKEQNLVQALKVQVSLESQKVSDQNIKFDKQLQVNSELSKKFEEQNAQLNKQVAAHAALVRELNLLKIHHQEITESGNQVEVRNYSLEKQSDNLSQQLVDKHQIIEQLNLQIDSLKEKIEAQTISIDEHQNANAALDQQYHILEQQLAQKQNQIEELTDRIGLLSQMTNDQSHDLVELRKNNSELNQQIQTQAVLIEQFNALKIQYQHLTDLKNQAEAKNSNAQQESAKLLMQLNKQMLEQQNTSESLKAQLADQGIHLDEKKHTIEQLNTRADAAEDIIEQLNSQSELNCAKLIHEQLIPMTEDYLQHLANEANKIDDTCEKIQTKHAVTLRLLNILTDTKTNPLPSSRIHAFSKELTDNSSKLNLHRDPDWLRYAKTCLVVIGVVCTGIIPGIIALLAFSQYTGKSPLFFAQSQGEQYCESAQNRISLVV